MEIRDIKQFMLWSTEGSQTYAQRLELFLRQKEAVEGEIRRLEKALAMIRYKCWYYERALQDGGEERLSRITPECLPKDIRALYDLAHGE